MDIITATFGLVGVVIIIAALLSGAIERARFPQVAVFILIGAVLGPAGLQLVNVDLQSPMLRVVAIMSLVLVLFTDAVNLNMREVRKHAKLAFLVLGPGTVITATVIGLAAWKLLDVPFAASMILGAALASTDPVMLRGLVRAPNLPASVKQALRMEGGLNDVVLLPIILIAMAFLQSSTVSGDTLLGLSFRMFLLGPGAGIIVGLLSIGVLELIRKSLGIRRDYESLYSLGVAFLAYAAAESVHGSGFLAAFAAGLVITLLDVELCDCFVEYGETTAEMALLFTFILFGTSLIWEGFEVMTLQTVLFALAVVLLRPIILMGTLLGSGLDLKSRMLISWFGPRGLSSLLLILLPVFAGIAGSAELFRLCCLVVLFSVLVHGGSQMFLLRGGKPEESRDEIVVNLDEMLELQKQNEDVILVDVRKESAVQESGMMADDTIRIDPDRVVAEADQKRLPKEAWLIAFCA